MASELDNSPLQVRLTEAVGKLPPGLIYLLPAQVSQALIQRRLAVPVGQLDAFPDLVIEEDELEDAGLDCELIQGS